jgi:hypothetical protein
MRTAARKLCCLPALVLLALCGCGGATRTVTVPGPPKSVRSGPAARSTASKTSTSASTPSKVVDLTAFRSPSGNIGCELLDGVARCDIGKRDWSPPARPASCPHIVDYGQGLEVGSSGPASFVCAGDTASEPSSPVLAYETASAVGQLLCVSRETGVTCTDRETAHGFFISIQSYRIF